VPEQLASEPLCYLHTWRILRSTCSLDAERRHRTVRGRRWTVRRRRPVWSVTTHIPVWGEGVVVCLMWEAELKTAKAFSCGKKLGRGRRAAYFFAAHVRRQCYPRPSISVCCLLIAATCHASLCGSVAPSQCIVDSGMNGSQCNVTVTQSDCYPSVLSLCMPTPCSLSIRTWLCYQYILPHIATPPRHIPWWSSRSSTSLEH